MRVRPTDIKAQKRKLGHRTMQQSKHSLWNSVTGQADRLPYATGVSYQA